jgi:hypothetical protein
MNLIARVGLGDGVGTVVLGTEYALSTSFMVGGNLDRFGRRRNQSWTR